jgi:hypothetical protein
MTGIGAILFSLVYTLLLEDSEKYNEALIQFQDAYADLTAGTARGEEEVVDDLIKHF